MYKLFKRSHIPGIFEVQMAGACDPGIARDHNEDAIGIQEDDGRGYYLAVVCDGMGGHNAGEVASALAVGVMSEYIETHFPQQQEHPERLLTEAVALANQKIDEQAEINPDAKGMGCTSVLVVGIRDHVWVANVGDSRVYRVRDGKAEQLTNDHTMVQEMVEGGLISPEQASVHPYRGRISRCIGHGKNKSNPDIVDYILQKDDNLLLCSDGLSDVVPTDELEALVGQRDVRDACRRLVDAANKHGGPDNISAIVLRRIV